MSSGRGLSHFSDCKNWAAAAERTTLQVIQRTGTHRPFCPDPMATGLVEVGVTGRLRASTYQSGKGPSRHCHTPNVELKAKYNIQSSQHWKSAQYLHYLNFHVMISISVENLYFWIGTPCISPQIFTLEKNNSELCIQPKKSTKE